MSSKPDARPQMPIWEFHGVTEAEWIQRAGPGWLCTHDPRHVITVPVLDGDPGKVDVVVRHHQVAFG